MANKPSFSISQALHEGWQTYKENFGFLLVTFILYAVITGLISGMQSSLQEQDSPLVLIPALASMLIGSLASIGWVRIGLKLLDGEKAEYEDLLRGTDRVVPYLLGSIVYGLIVMLGFVLLIIPGVYWMLKYMYVPYLIADKKLPISEALRTSGEMTNGVKLHLIGFGFVQLGLVLLGTIALVVGLIAVLPTLWLASLSIYRQLQGSSDSGGTQSQADTAAVEAQSEPAVTDDTNQTITS